VHLKRKTVLQIGSAAVEEESFHKLQKHFIEHGLILTISTFTQIPSETNSACGILIAEKSGKIGFIRSCFETLNDIAEDSGLAFAVLVPTSEELGVVQRLIHELRMESCATVSLTEDAGNAAEYLARWNPGPPFGKPTILPPGLGLPSRADLILQRSFYDCDRIYLQPLGGGRDAAGVFCVHAWLRKSIVGPRPLPYFIKFSSLEKINSERFNYEYYADFYIPFYLRPNVVPARCAQIKGLASIVGNFVEDSVPLRTVLRATQNPGIIFSLFEISLRGFRSQPDSGPTLSWDQPLENFVRERARAADVIADTVRIAQSSFGLKSTPTEIENRLCTAVGTVKRRFSPYHGDLHSGNVMVRGRDAILIDFSAVKNGPLTADPATLEVSLVFGTDNDDKLGEFEEWKKAVDEFYDGVPLHEPPSLGIGPGPFAWLYRALRGIRHVLLGCDCKQEEAAAVLAAYLLRFGRLKPEKFEDAKLTRLAEFRQAYALVIAERIVESLVAKKGTGAT